VYHGVATKIIIAVADEVLFQNLPNEFEVGRYHSWVVQSPLPADLEITALDEQGQIMALRHRKFDVRAVQFHPESVLTPNGKQILANWLNS
jgi:anthranilate synthase component 2